MQHCDYRYAVITLPPTSVAVVTDTIGASRQVIFTMDVLQDDCMSCIQNTWHEIKASISFSGLVSVPSMSDELQYAIIEPILQMTTRMSQSTTEANGIVGVQIQIQHALESRAPAYSLQLSTNTSFGLTVLQDTFSGSVINATTVDLAVGDSITLVFNVVVDSSVRCGDVLTIEGILGWQSQPSTRGSGRLYDAPSDQYEALLTRSSIVVDKSSVSLHAEGTGLPGTLFPDFAVGEDVTFNAYVSVPHAEAMLLRLVVAMPAGLSLLNTSVLSIGAGIWNFTSYEPTTVGTIVTYRFGNVSGAFAAPEEERTIAIALACRVLDTEGNADGQPHSISATVSSITSSLLPVSTSTALQYTTVDPLFHVEVSTPTSKYGAQEILNWTVLVYPATQSKADAYDLVCTGALTIPDAAAVASWSVLTNDGMSVARGNDSFNFSIPYMPRIAAPVQVIVQVITTSTVISRTVGLRVAVDLHYKSSDAVDGRHYLDNDSATRDSDNPTAAINLFGTSYDRTIDDNVVPGETVAVSITIFFPRVSTNVSRIEVWSQIAGGVSDALNAQTSVLTVGSGVLCETPGEVFSGEHALRYYVGQCVGTGLSTSVIVLDATFLVGNETTFPSAQTVQLSGQVTYTRGVTGRVATSTQSTTLTIVEPSPTTEISWAPTDAFDGNDMYTVTCRVQGGAMGVPPARNLRSTLVFTPSSRIVSFASPNHPVALIDTHTLASVTADSDFAPGNSAEIVVQVQLPTLLWAADSGVNATWTLEYDSIAPPTARTKQYVDTYAIAPVIRGPTQTIVSVLSSDPLTTPADVAVGETLSVLLDVAIPEITTAIYFHLMDPFDGGVGAFLVASLQVYSVGANIECFNGDADVAGGPTLYLGNCTNTVYDNRTTADDVIRLVIDLSAVPAPNNTMLQAYANLTYQTESALGPFVSTFLGYAHRLVEPSVRMTSSGPEHDAIKSNNVYVTVTLTGTFAHDVALSFTVLDDACAITNVMVVSPASQSVFTVLPLVGTATAALHVGSVLFRETTTVIAFELSPTAASTVGAPISFVGNARYSSSNTSVTAVYYNDTQM